MEDWIKDLQNFNPIVRKGDFVPYDEKYWRKGWKHTDEARKLMSEARKGKAPWNKGLKGAQKHSEETKEKCRIAGRKSSGTKGRKQTEEEKQKRSEALKKYYAGRRAAGHKR